MKKLLLIFALVFFSSCASRTSFNSFYQKNQKDADFSLGLSASLIKPFLSGEDYKDVKPILKKAKHIRILVFSENAEKKSDKFNTFIKKSDFEKIIKIKDDDDKIAFFTLEDKSKIKEVVLQINSDDDLILLGLKTNLTQKDIDKLMSQ